MTVMSVVPRCVFCAAELAPGSVEHVFLAALGGRLATRRATCGRCNNQFATAVSGKIDDALAQSFSSVRCALMIWSGRDAPPPTLKRMGRTPDGLEFDVAPGFVALPRPAPVPDLSAVAPGDTVRVVARDIDDAKRLLSIAERRGLKTKVLSAQRLRTQGPHASLPLEFDLPKVYRSLAKTAVVGACVLFGNDAARNALDPTLLRAIAIDGLDIIGHCGWDYTNEWPAIASTRPHQKSPDAKVSGFEHSLLVLDVGSSLVGYVELFGAFRFSVRLGSRSGLQPRGMSLNPRSRRNDRFEVAVTAPDTYQTKWGSALDQEVKSFGPGLEASYRHVLSTWNQEASSRHFENLANELLGRMQQALDNDEERAEVVAKWVREVASIEVSGDWSEDLDTSVFCDE